VSGVRACVLLAWHVHTVRLGVNPHARNFSIGIKGKPIAHQHSGRQANLDGNRILGRAHAQCLEIDEGRKVWVLHDGTLVAVVEGDDLCVAQDDAGGSDQLGGRRKGLGNRLQLFRARHTRQGDGAKVRVQTSFDGLDALRVLGKQRDTARPGRTRRRVVVGRSVRIGRHDGCQGLCLNDPNRIFPKGSRRRVWTK
jgi:hypothetical protein